MLSQLFLSPALSGSDNTHDTYKTGAHDLKLPGGYLHFIHCTDEWAITFISCSYSYVFGFISWHPAIESSYSHFCRTWKRWQAPAQPCSWISGTIGLFQCSYKQAYIMADENYTILRCDTWSVFCIKIAMCETACESCISFWVAPILIHWQ